MALNIRAQTNLRVSIEHQEGFRAEPSSETRISRFVDHVSRQRTYLRLQNTLRHNLSGQYMELGVSVLISLAMVGMILTNT